MDLSVRKNLTGLNKPAVTAKVFVICGMDVRNVLTAHAWFVEADRGKPVAQLLHLWTVVKQVNAKHV